MENADKPRRQTPMNKTISLNNGLQSFLALLFIGLIGVGLVLVDKPIVITALFFIAWGVVAVFRLSVEKLFPFYLVFLMFEGSFKVLSRYNPVVHVGADILLIIVTCRLILHPRTKGLIDSLDPVVKNRFTVIVYFLAIFWVWVAVQFFNPWGLGLLPSLAGLKTYVLPALTFFIIGFLISEKEVKTVVFILLCLGTLQAIAAIFDWYMGPGFLISVSSKYADVAKEFLQGMPYRPFGTTQVPGAPAVWMSHTLLAALIVIYFLNKKAIQSRAGIWRTLLFAYFPLAITTLLICQVRIIILRFLALAFVATFLIAKKYAFFSLSVLVLAGALAWNYQPKIDSEDFTKYVSVDKRMHQALARAMTLKTLATYKNARNASWIFSQFQLRARSTTQGIGLSRISASSRPWVKLIEADRFFGDSWRFADNLYLAIFTELGFFGLCAFLLLMLSVLWQLIFAGTFFGRIIFFYSVFVLISGLGAEGFLYQPDASLFWIYAALGLRLKNADAPCELKHKSGIPSLSPA
jgi:hypothetical protein